MRLTRDCAASTALTTNDTAVGLLDLQRLRLALLHPDRMEYAASVAKIGILLAYFQVHQEAATSPKTSELQFKVVKRLLITKRVKQQ